MNTWWHSDFQTNFSEQELPVNSGRYAAVGNGVLSRVTPVSAVMNGDFDFEFGFQFGEINLGYDMITNLKTWAGVTLASIWWDESNAKLYNFMPSVDIDNVDLAFSVSGSFRFKYLRQNDIISCRYNIGGGWVDFPTSRTQSGSVYLEAQSQYIEPENIIYDTMNENASGGKIQDRFLTYAETGTGIEDKQDIM